MPDKLLELLEKNFGHTQFRRPQREIIESVLSGTDTLAIMPTGGGKSLCYQLPALASDGVTLVVSPLIALMKDQVDALAARGISAAMINSSQTSEEQRLALAKLRLGDLKLAYIAPERFRMASFTRALAEAKISLLAIDEAHCISQWGHDFRPDYARLGEVVERLGRPTVAAFTATATPEVKEDILVQLKMRTPKIFVSGFARPNLSLNVIEVSTKAEKENRVRDIIEKYKTGIVYCSTRKSVESLSAALWEDGIRHIIYHGGMTSSERDSAQEAFVGGRENVAIATNAFGMGIDRADIRFVCHYELTGSLEAFYQEAGRAGRDGKPAYCAMLMMYSDKRVQEFFIDGANPTPEFIRAVYSTIRANSDEGNECVMSIEDIAEAAAEKVRDSSCLRRGRASRSSSGAAAQNMMAVSSSIAALRRMGVIDRYDIAGMRSRGTRLLQPDTKPSQLKIPEEELLNKRMRDENKLRDVIKFAYTRECRQQWILKYFGETEFQPCQNCDNCKRNGTSEFGQTEFCKAEVLDIQQIEIVRKALSCVARMSRRVAPREWTPIFGKTLIQDCLLGSKNKRILKFGYDKIPTHSALKSLGKKFVSSLFSALENQGYLETVQGEYPLLGLTSKGVQMMMGEIQNPKMEFPSTSIGDELAKEKSTDTVNAKKKKIIIADAESQNPQLLQRLTILRNKIRREKKVPAYVILTNAVLLELSNRAPRTAAQAMEIKGVGEVKLANTLPPFLREINDFLDGK